MFDIWRPSDSDTVARVVSFQRDYCSESLVADKVRADECDLCPYPGYRFVRLTYSAQRARVVRGVDDEERYEIVEGTISYLLLRTIPGSDSTEVIPLNPDAATLYAINRNLRLKLSKETVATYLVFFGLIISGRGESFYFVTNVNHIATIRSHLSDASRLLIDGMIQATFNVRPDGSLDLRLKEKSYWILGKAFTLSVPAIYGGGAYRTDVRISEVGFPVMDEDDKTTIRGLDDQLPISKRYSLEFAPQVAGPILRSKRAVGLQTAAISQALALERALSYLLLPTYILSLVIAALVGPNNGAIYNYYEELKKLNILSRCNLVLGLLLALGVILRFVVMEVAAMTEKWVPNQLSQFFQRITGVLEEQRKKMGPGPFMTIAILEFMSGAFLALNLLLYGISNTLRLPVASKNMNFVEVFVLIVFSVPGLGSALRWIFDIREAIGFYRVYQDPVWNWLSASFLSTIAFGWVVRLFRMSKGKS